MPLPRKKPKDDDANAARGRLRRNAYNPSSRFLGDDNDNEAKEYAGVKGEEAVARFLCLDPTPIKSKKKMKGFNLVGPNGEKINAITSRKKPQWLPVEVGHEQADIYVQCHFDGRQKQAKCIGWATRDDLFDAGRVVVRQLIGGGPDNRCIFHTVLRDMEELKRMMVPHTKDMFDEPEADVTT